MDYGLIKADSCLELENHVARAISRGYRPSGPLIITHSSVGHYCQPVTRTALMRLWTRMLAAIRREPFVLQRRDLTIQGFN